MGMTATDIKRNYEYHLSALNKATKANIKEVTDAYIDYFRLAWGDPANDKKLLDSYNEKYLSRLGVRGAEDAALLAILGETVKKSVGDVVAGAVEVGQALKSAGRGGLNVIKILPYVIIAVVAIIVILKFAKK